MTDSDIVVPFEQLDGQQQTAIAYKITHPQETYEQIAKATGIKPALLNTWRLNTLTDCYRADVVKVLLAEIERSSLLAVATLVKQLDSEDERIAQASAIKLLEWQIGKPTQRTENFNQTLTQIAIVETNMRTDRL